MQPRQLVLPELGEPRAPGAATAIDDASGEFLARYEAERGKEVAAATVRSEVSQLRVIARAGLGLNPMRVLLELLDEQPLLARLLTSPPSPIAESTARLRLRAVIAALAVDVSPERGRERQDVQRALLPHRPTRRWDESGAGVVGQRNRARPPSPTIGPHELVGIVARAGRDESHALRDRALVGVLAFSGLQLGEAVGLRWMAASWDPQFEGFVVGVVRAGEEPRLPVLGEGARQLIRYRLSLSSSSAPSEFVFSGRFGDRGLDERQARRILADAGRQSGLSPMRRSDLRRGFVSWLRAAIGLTDHEIARVLGVRDLRAVDRLSRSSASLHGQRELGGRVL